MKKNNKIKYILLSVLSLLMACETDDTIPVRNISVMEFEPLAALGNDTIAIYGAGFSPDTILNVVEFSGTKLSARVLAAEVNKLIVIVPEATIAGVVKVIVGVNSAVSERPFLLSPSISSINPEGALAGEQIVVQGRNFTTDLDKLVVKVGDVLVDSLFGGSSSQVIFPLPSGLPVGETTIKVGTILSENDTVFAPAASFVVFDPEKPSITDIRPRAATPGSQITLFGNGFKTDPDSIFVTIGGVEVTSFIELDDDELKLLVPKEISVEGQGQVVVEVTLSNRSSKGEIFTSFPVEFTVVEPSNILFYYSALNNPGALSSETDDDALYVAESVSGGLAIITQVARQKFISGVAYNLVTDVLYFGDASSGLHEFEPKSGDVSSVAGYPTVPHSDIVYNADQNLIFYYSNENGELNSYNPSSAEEVEGHLSSSDFGNADPTIFKFDDDVLYWVAGKKAGSYNIETKVKNSLFPLNTTTTGLIAIAIGDNDLYLAEGPTASYSNANVAGNSKIYRGNKDGTGILELLYDRSNVSITDMEISEDGKILFWMEGDSNGSGAIMSAPAERDESKIQTVIPGIKTGRYFTVVRKD